MLPHVYLSVQPHEGTHHVSVDLDMEEAPKATLLDALVRPFERKCCVVEDLDPPSRCDCLLPGGVLDLLDRKPPLSGEQEARARELRERDSEPEG